MCAHSCLTLCNPMDCSLPGSSVHGILQARILEWVAVSFSRGYPPDPGIEPKSLVSTALAGGFFITAPPGKPPWAYRLLVNSSRYEAEIRLFANPEHVFPTAMSYVLWNSVLLPRGTLPGTTDSKEPPSCLIA